MVHFKVTVRGLLGLFILAVCDGCSGQAYDEIHNHNYYVDDGGIGGEVITHNPTPVALTTIDIPEDVDDDVVVGTVNPAFIDLANGLKNEIDNVADHEDRIVLLELGESALPGFAPASVTDPINITVDYLDVSGKATVDKEVSTISNVDATVTIYFLFTFTPTGSGLKSVELPVTNTPVIEPDDDFAQGFDAIGHGTARTTAVDPYSAVMVFAVPGTKRVKVEWYDTHTSGTGVCRGSFRYSKT